MHLFMHKWGHLVQRKFPSDTVKFPPQTLATSCHLPLLCWTPAFTTPTSETSPQWSASSPWTEGSMRGETSQRNYSGWDLISSYAWTIVAIFCVSETLSVNCKTWAHHWLRYCSLLSHEIKLKIFQIKNIKKCWSIDIYTSLPWLYVK